MTMFILVSKQKNNFPWLQKRYDICREYLQLILEVNNNNNYNNKISMTHTLFFNTIETSRRN